MRIALYTIAISMMVLASVVVRGSEPTDVAGDWVFTMKWDRGGKLEPQVRIVKDENLETVPIKTEQRDELKKEYAGYAAYAGKAEWTNKGVTQSETWIVLVKETEVRIFTKLFACLGQLSTKGSSVEFNEAKGKCSISLVNMGGSFQATRAIQQNK